MKILVDFLPILVFFITFKLFGIFAATATAILVSLLQLLLMWIKERRLEMMHLITAGVMLVLGGATLVFQNIWFIKWKPTVINWILAAAFFASQYLQPKTFIQRLMEGNLSLPQAVWKKINLSWVIFFIVLGAVNLFVAYNFNTDTWVNFKLFGILGLTIVFVLVQAFYLTRYAMHLNKTTSESL